MQLGAFSISLAVKDLGKSQTFYEQLGFERTGGDAHYAIMVNPAGTVIGLFQGMFEKNILTFNPGLDNERIRQKSFEPLETFEDVRDLQKTLEDRGFAFEEKADPEGTGIGHFVITDPDGNPILVDQHFPKPASG